MLRVLAIALAAASAAVSAKRTTYSLDAGWRYMELGHAGPGKPCAPNAFPDDMHDQACSGLKQQGGVKTEDACARTCCNAETCETYQWCNTTDCMPSAMAACWTGRRKGCHASKGWKSRGRTAAPVPPPAPPSGNCTEIYCKPGFDDSSWARTSVPHDYVVENTFTQTGDKSHGFLPYGVAWYRKKLALPAATKGQTTWLTFDGVMLDSVVYLNGVQIGGHASGYTPFSIMLDEAQHKLKFGADGSNELVLKVDATHPDGWWYDGGGIYRHVTLTSASPELYIGDDFGSAAVYAPSVVTGAIDQTTMAADGALHAEVTVVYGSAAAGQFTVSATVTDPSGKVVATVKAPVPTGSSGNTTVAFPLVKLPAAKLWSVETPRLYSVAVTVLKGSTAIDAATVTFGVRKTKWDSEKGFFLNDVPTKIKGNANHQDFAGVGVAVPDIIQAHRIQKLKDMGSNGWRTAHNVPTRALLDAADRLGFLVWDENHRNGQDSECEILVRRDRNHPSIVIWSLCNEVLCNTKDTKGDALRLKKLIKKLDPLGQRVVSANNNGINGPDTPLDLQGYDYNTKSYDQWHKASPGIPQISSETSSAVSDRGELIDNATAGHMSCYDDPGTAGGTGGIGNRVGWGQTAQGAWGGVGEKNQQGILTRDYMCGGFTWTGWDYKGEPTPYAWPDINSHFGIIDEAGFPKDRYYWYKAWFTVWKKGSGMVHVFPHWNHKAGASVKIWAFSNADEVELLLNGKSLGRQPSGNYSHAQWKVSWAAGKLVANAYSGGKQIATDSVSTTGAAAALRASVKDGVGSSHGGGVFAGCKDIALIQVEVVDAAGLVVPTADHNVTLAVSGGGASIIGTGNGNPACHVHDKSLWRPAFHGLMLGVVQSGEDAGDITVTASSAGLKTASVVVKSVKPAASYSEWWCKQLPAL